MRLEPKQRWGPPAARSTKAYIFTPFPKRDAAEDLIAHLKQSCAMYVRRGALNGKSRMSPPQHTQHGGKKHFSFQPSYFPHCCTWTPEIIEAERPLNTHVFTIHFIAFFLAACQLGVLYMHRAVVPIKGSYVLLSLRPTWHTSGVYVQGARCLGGGLSAVAAYSQQQNQ